MVLLRAQPSLLPHAMESIAIPSSETLQADSMAEYNAILSHLIYLLTHVDIDPHIRFQLRSFQQSETDDPKAALSSLSNSIIDGMIPAGIDQSRVIRDSTSTSFVS